MTSGYFDLQSAVCYCFRLLGGFLGTLHASRATMLSTKQPATVEISASDSSASSIVEQPVTNIKGGFSSVSVRDSCAYKRYKESGLSRGFLIEVAVLKKTQHTNVVPFVRAFLDESVPIVVLAAFDGPLQKMSKAMAKKYLHCITRQLTFGLAHVHAAGFLHRDVKPSNVLVRYTKQQPHVVLSDFNSAAVASPGRCMTVLPTTYCYAAPELLMYDTTYGYEVDAWSLGITLLELILGKRLFLATEPEELLTAISTSLGVPSHEDLNIKGAAQWPPRSKPTRACIEQCENEKVRCLIDRLLQPVPRLRMAVVDAAGTFFGKFPEPPMHREDISRRIWSGAVNENMRTLVTDWLADVCRSFRADANVLLQAVCTLDIVVHQLSVDRSSLQKIASACLYISMIMFDSNGADMEDIVKVSDNCFTLDELREATETIGELLEYAAIHEGPTSTVRECWRHRESRSGAREA